MWLDEWADRHYSPDMMNAAENTATVIAFPTERTRGPAALALALMQAQVVISGAVVVDDAELARISDTLAENIAWRASQEDAAKAGAEEERRDLLAQRTAQMEAETHRHTGSKYESVKNSDPAEVAALIRADIKAEVKAGRLPKATYSVRLSRYAGGRSIDVRASRFPFAVHVEGWEAARDAGVKKAWLSRDAYAVEVALTAIVDAYRRAVSHGQSDYYECNFHGDVTVSE